MRRAAVILAAGALAAAGVMATQEKCVARQGQIRPLGCALRLTDGGVEDVYPRSIPVSQAVGNECSPAECAP